MKRILTILTCLLLTLLLLAACAPARLSPAPAAPGSPAPSVAPSAPTPDAAFPAAPETAPGGGATRNFTPSPGETLGPLPIITPDEAGSRMLTYTATMHLQTTDFMPGVRLILDTTAALRGFYERFKVFGNDIRVPLTERSANFRLRIPTERLGDFIAMAENNFPWMYVLSEMDDQTVRYQRADLRLEDLREQEQRVLDNLEDQELTVADRRRLEQDLAGVQRTINDLMMQQITIEHDVIYSTVHVRLFEVIFPEEREEEPPVMFGDRLNDRVSRSIAAFVAFCQGLLLAVVTIAPAILLLAIIVAIALLTFFAVRKYRQRQRAKQAQTQMPQQTLTPDMPPAQNQTEAKNAAEKPRKEE